MTCRISLGLFTILCLWAQPAKAALFCVEVNGLSSQCIYDDPAECRTRAVELNGICDLNPAEATVSPGFGLFCLVGANRVSQCVYSDRNSCEEEASRNHASVCVQNNLAGIQPSPFRYTPQRAY